MCNHGRLPGCILGTTSKYFLESLSNFPNVFRMDDPSRPVLEAEYKSHIRCDKMLLKSLDSCHDKNAELRRYFSNLTSTYMASFDPMFKPIPFVPRSAHPHVFNPFLDQPRLPGFCT